MLQFVSTIEANVQSLSGSPVQVTIDSITAGSVSVATTTIFLNGDSNSALAYQTTMTSGNAASRIFGTGFGSVAVDASSVNTKSVSNPSKPGHMHHNLHVQFACHCLSEHCLVYIGVRLTI